MTGVIDRHEAVDLDIHLSVRGAIGAYEPLPFTAVRLRDLATVAIQAR